MKGKRKKPVREEGEAPKKQLCRNRAHVLIPGATICTQCNKHQDFRWYFEDWDAMLKALGALFIVISSVGGALLIIHNWIAPSRTRVAFAQADRNALYVNVANTGVRRAYFRGAELTFGPLPIEKRALDVVVTDRGVVNAGFAAASETRVGLLVRGLRTATKSGSNERYTRDEIEQLLRADSDAAAVLQVQIEESNGKLEWHPLEIRVSLIRHLILAKLPKLEAEL